MKPEFIISDFLAGTAQPAPGSSTEGMLIYAIGDIHGRYDLLKIALAKIVNNAAIYSRGRKPTLLFCGDYVDRGPESAKVIQTLVWLKRRPDFEVHLLKGNHEEGLLRFLQDPLHQAAWLEFGGRETLTSYDVEIEGQALGRQSLLRLRDDLLDALPVSHMVLLDELDVMLVVGDYAFVHAGVRPGTPLNQQTEADLLWIRQPFLQSRGSFGKIIVHGHTWTGDVPELFWNRLGIDTGAYETGVLSVLRLDGDQMQLIRARAPIR